MCSLGKRLVILHGKDPGQLGFGIEAFPLNERVDRDLHELGLKFGIQILQGI